jgi:hypothetical protein
MARSRSLTRIASLAGGLSLLVALSSLGCAVYSPPYAYSQPYAYSPSYATPVVAVQAPPTYAVNGYVYSVGSIALVFESSWNGYCVRGHPGYYYQRGYYYRWYGSRWQRAPRFAGPWAWVEPRYVPAPLRGRHEGHREGRHEVAVPAHREAAAAWTPPAPPQRAEFAKRAPAAPRVEAGLPASPPEPARRAIPASRRLSTPSQPAIVEPPRRPEPGRRQVVEARPSRPEPAPHARAKSPRVSTPAVAPGRKDPSPGRTRKHANRSGDQAAAANPSASQ